MSHNPEKLGENAREIERKLRETFGDDVDKIPPDARGKIGAILLEQSDASKKKPAENGAKKEQATENTRHQESLAETDDHGADQGAEHNDVHHADHGHHTRGKGGVGKFLNESKAVTTAAIASIGAGATALVYEFPSAIKMLTSGIPQLPIIGKPLEFLIEASKAFGEAATPLWHALNLPLWTGPWIMGSLGIVGGILIWKKRHVIVKTLRRLVKEVEETVTQRKLATTLGAAAGYIAGPALTGGFALPWTIIGAAVGNYLRKRQLAGGGTRRAAAPAGGHGH